MLRQRGAEPLSEFNQGTLGYLKEWGLALDRIAVTLENYPPTTFAAAERDRVVEMLSAHIAMLDQLAEGIKRWKEAASEQAALAPDHEAPPSRR